MTDDNDKTYLRLEDVSGGAREHGAMQVEVGVSEGLVVHRHHLDAARPNTHGVEVRRVDPHTSRVHSHQLMYNARRVANVSKT